MHVFAFVSDVHSNTIEYVSIYAGRFLMSALTRWDVISQLEDQEEMVTIPMIAGKRSISIDWMPPKHRRCEQLQLGGHMRKLGGSSIGDFLFGVSILNKVMQRSGQQVKTTNGMSTMTRW